MTKTLIKNGTVWLEDRALIADVLVQDGLIAEIGTVTCRIDDCEIIDAASLHVLPGFIDIHTHLDDEIGGYRLADDWATGSEMALVNGITTLCGFITQRPGRPLRESAEAALGRAEAGSLCDYAFHLTPVTFGKGDWAYMESLASDGFRTFKFYTTYRQAGLYLGYEDLGIAMQRVSEMGLGVLAHCEDDGLLEQARGKIADRSDPFSHTLSRPAKAEVEAVERVLAMARRTKCRTHIVHVSTAEAAELILRARGEAPITCETCPQYLFLSEDRLRGEEGHRFICSPPFRSEENRRVLCGLGLSGAFDAYATDHCAFSRRDKDEHLADFAKVPNGLPGIGALVPLIWELHGDPGAMALRLALNPAKIAGLYPRKGVIRKGSDADLVILGAECKERVMRSSLSDVYEPYPDKTTRLEASRVLLRGMTVVAGGEITSRIPGKRA